MAFPCVGLLLLTNLCRAYDGWQTDRPIDRQTGTAPYTLHMRHQYYQKYDFIAFSKLEVFV